MIVIADCTGQIEQPMQMTFDVIHYHRMCLRKCRKPKR